MNPTRSTQRGITLIDQLVALAVTAVSASTLVPAAENMLMQRRLDAAASLLRTDLAHARSTAVARRESVRLRIEATDTGSCYVLHTGAADACNCSAAGPVCAGNAQPLRSEWLPLAGPRLRANVESMLFDANFGTVTPTGTLQLTDGRGAALRLVINVMGRVRLCTTTPGMVRAPTC